MVVNKLKLLLRGRLAHLMSTLPFSWMPSRRRISLADTSAPCLIEFPAVDVLLNPLPDEFREAFQQAVPDDLRQDALKIPARRGYFLVNSRVRMPESLVLSSEGYIIDESLSTPNYLDTLGFLLEFFRRKPLVHHEAPGFMLGLPFQKNYHLWLSYGLPRLAAFAEMTKNESKSVVLLISEHVPRFIHDSLASYTRRHPGVNIKYLPVGTYMLPTLYLMQPMSVKDLPNPVAVNWLRSTFLDSKTSPISRKRRLYLTRSGALERDLLNESLLLERLIDLSFEKLDCGALTFDEQVTAFRDAEVIIGPHGASFSNLVFTSSNTLVIELFGGSHYLPCFAFLATLRELRYVPFGLESAGAHMIITASHVQHIMDVLVRESIT